VKDVKRQVKGDWHGTKIVVWREYSPGSIAHNIHTNHADSYEDNAETVCEWWTIALATLGAVWQVGVLDGILIERCHESLKVRTCTRVTFVTFVAAMAVADCAGCCFVLEVFGGGGSFIVPLIFALRRVEVVVVMPPNTPSIMAPRLVRWGRIKSQHPPIKTKASPKRT
jgi:hypothetical protein